MGASVAIVAFVMLRTVLSSWSAAADYAAQDRIATRHKVTFVMTLPKNYVDQVRLIPGVTQATYMNWFGAKDPNRPNEFFATLAMEPRSALDVYDEVVVPPDQKQAWFEDKQGAVVGDVLARKMGW